MQQLKKLLSSSTLSMLTLFALILVIGLATFIEEKYDTATASLLIYHAKWFELLMVLLIVLLVLNMINKKLFSKDKIAQIIFHFSFIVMIIGGGVTRYFGYEANMHIIENETVSTLYTLEPYLQLKIPDENIEYTSKSPIYFSQIQSNTFHLEFEAAGRGKIELDYKDYVYNTPNLTFREYLEERNDKSLFVAGDSDQENPDALIVEITIEDKQYEAVLYYDDTRYIQPFQSFIFEDLELELTYGPKPVHIPFALKLLNFTLSKYPGSDIPSGSESKIVLIDERNNLKEEHLIYKNHVLDYDGYRFFQTSYDDDEKGTILSVNYDYFGTRITYFSYFLMVLGAVLILFSKKSHFSQLDKKIKEIRDQRKVLAITVILLIGTSIPGISQNIIQNSINQNHADKFGKLIVQTYDGRFTSVHSLASDVIHKISFQDKIVTEGKGEMDAMHAFLDMHADPGYWRKQEIIVVREKALRKMLGVNGKYASFNDFFTRNNSFKLDELVQNAFQKKASEQSTLDREIIKVTERVNILSMTLNGTLLKLFPLQSTDNHKWVSWNDSLAFIPLNGELMILNDYFQLQEFTYSNIMRSYLISTLSAKETGNYTESDRILGYIRSIQRQLTPEDIVPSENKINLEILYNNSKIFLYLKYLYALIGITLLILTFIENFKITSNRQIQMVIKVSVAILIGAFIYHTMGMGMRWYLSGHAPWSNGYEVLLLVAWGGVLAGFSVIKHSKITLASTALMASVILMVAGLSYYDPQMTNLEPVLKSYWLIVHVAIISIGYSFLTLGFILAMINLLIFLFTPGSKVNLSQLIVLELTFINEKLLTIGMFLTAVGTFIGCIWANESWGTYWSWNAKQTWSLIIILVYAVILHFRLIPKMKSPIIFNIGAIISFASVIMTFIGVNYYFTKGLHSYASDDPPVFPLWAWITIIGLILLITVAVIKENLSKNKMADPLIPASEKY